MLHGNPVVRPASLGVNPSNPPAAEPIPEKLRAVRARKHVPVAMEDAITGRSMALRGRSRLSQGAVTRPVIAVASHQAIRRSMRAIQPIRSAHVNTFPPRRRIAAQVAVILCGRIVVMDIGIGVP